MPETEFRYAPLVTPQAGSPHFEGRVMVYGAVGRGPHGPEVFLPGSFGQCRTGFARLECPA